jgi:hypothetical protein
MWTFCEAIARTHSLPWATRDAQLPLLPILWARLGGEPGQSTLRISISASFLVSHVYLTMESLERLYLPLALSLAAVCGTTTSDSTNRVLVGITGAAGKTIRCEA